MGFWWGDLMEIGGYRWSMILKWIFKKWDGEAWIGLSGTGQGQLAGACKSNNEPLGSMKCRECLD